MPDLAAALRDLRLALSPDDLAAVRRSLAERLREGAARDGAELAMLPAWLAPPSPGLRGEAVALDAGGTNLRAARVRAAGGGVAEVVGEVRERPLPGAAGSPAATAEEFFAAHGALLREVGAPPGLPVGYCFSYPTRVEPDGDAVLLRWTKEVRVGGLTGARVGALLLEHLRAAAVLPGAAFVLNDTIAALAAGASAPGVDPLRAVGLIVGTGMNVGAYLPVSVLGKLPAGAWSAPAMAVNFEVGAFRPPGLGAADDDVDAGSQDPGAQRFEKAVSGAYLGRVLAAAARRLGLPLAEGEAGSAEVSRLAAQAPESPAEALARAVLDRSADSVAAALAAASDVLAGSGDLHVLAEGSLIARGPGYADRVRATLASLLAASATPARAHLGFRRDANLLGTALAALAHAERVA